MMRWLDRWSAIWEGTEHPRVLASVRILLASSLLWDFGQIWYYDLITALFGPITDGGWSHNVGTDKGPWLYQLIESSGWTASMHFWVLVCATVCVLVGFFTRTSTVIVLMLYATQALILPLSDRGIDMLCRDVLLILLFSGCGRCWSVDSLWSTGSWGAPDVRVSRWPRYLLIVQLVVMYFTAGVQKVGLLWTPFGGYAALYVILQDPAIARVDFSWLATQPFYLFTQLATAVTVFWQASYPLVILWLFYKQTPERPGRLRALSNRFKLHWVWVAVGAFFHLQLALTMQLGIFPWAMMAIYPVYFDPDEWRGLVHRLIPARLLAAT